MAGKLAQEIHRQRPFDCLQQEVFLNVLRTADFLLRGLDDMLKPHGLSHVQYNILRILRGAHSTGNPPGQPAGMACKAIAEHMITRDPDITRLLDRLEARGLITRSRDARDRRVVASVITDAGLAMLHELDGPLLDFHTRQLAHVDESRMRSVIEVMEELRSTSEDPVPENNPTPARIPTPASPA